MPAVVYKELVRKNRQKIWIEKILITSPKKDEVIYDGEFRKYDIKLLKLIKKYCDDFESFCKRHNIKVNNPL